MNNAAPSIIRTRFAPSPTGLLTLGNIRTALFNYLWSKQQKGEFILRIEDTDAERSKSEYVDAIINDLNWLEMECSSPLWRQSERSAIYAKYYQQLLDNNQAYNCFCSAEKLERTRKLQASSGQPPRYPGTCRHLSSIEVANKIANGELSTLRFKVERGDLIKFVDLVKGPQEFKGQDIGDFIIRRQDGTSAFFFCNAIDDALAVITHVLRGDDHLSNTPRQLLILQALGLHTPEYGHFAMINAVDGTKLSKRTGSKSVKELREEGYHPLAIANCLARLGHYYADQGWQSMEQLASNFILDQVSKAPARFDIRQLEYWQKTTMQKIDLEQLVEFLEPQFSGYAVDKINFINAVRSNLLFPQDLQEWLRIVTVMPEYNPEAQEIFITAGKSYFDCAHKIINLIGTEYVNYQDFISQLKDQTKYNGKALFLPLRLSLTGTAHGIELDTLFKLIPANKIIERLHKAEQICQQ